MYSSFEIIQQYLDELNILIDELENIKGELSFVEH